MAEQTERYHEYFAEAVALKGHLKLPLEHEIAPRAALKLTGRKGGYEAKQEREFRVESAISFRSAYTQVAGNLELKEGHGWATLATAVVEGLNILDVVTADRIVAQVSTEHPLAGYVPSITFLGTRFENLRIAGHPVNPVLDLKFLGDKPEKDAPYTKNEEFMNRVAQQSGHFLAQMRLPAELEQGYNRVPSEEKRARGVECSLVSSVAPADATDPGFPGRCFGHAIEIPHFGVIYLATVRLEESDPNPETGIPMQTTLELKMLDIRMGCLASGGTDAGGVVVNGHSKP